MNKLLKFLFKASAYFRGTLGAKTLPKHSHENF